MDVLKLSRKLRVLSLERAADEAWMRGDYDEADRCANEAVVLAAQDIPPQEKS